MRLKVLTRAGSPRRKYRRYRDESAYLLSSSANARRLLDALNEAHRGEGVCFTSIDELREALLRDRP